jgi:hypothetical protein
MAAPTRGRAAAVSTLVLTGALLASHAAAAANDACFDAAEQGQLLRVRGDLVGARQQLIVCTADGCPATVRHDCAQWLAQVEAATPSITVHARDMRGQDVIGARVLLDDRVVAPRLDGTAIVANPGPHRVRLETPSGARYDEEILLTEGQKERLIDARFDVALGADGMPPRVAPEGAPTPTVRADGGLGSATVLAGGLAVLGLVGLGLATYFEIAGQNEYSALHNGCGPTKSCAQGDIDASKQKLYVLAPVTFGVGVVSLGVAAGVLLLGRKAETRAAELRIDVVPVRGVGGAAMMTRQF